MFGAEPYQFEPTYPPGEEPAPHGEGEERSASPEPVRIGNLRTGVFEGNVRKRVLSNFTYQGFCRTF